MNSDKCLIWPDNDAMARDGYIGGRHSVIISSPRAAGDYAVTQPGWHALHDLDVDAKARLTTILVDWRNQHGEGEVPPVTPEMINWARNSSSLAVHERAVRLLRFMATQSKSIGDAVNLNWAPARTSDTDKRAMAWSESTTLGEVQFLQDYLIEQRWIRKVQDTQFTVTVDGHRRIADLRTNSDSAQAFVAMWFDDEMDSVYEKGVEPAIRSAGYKAMRIDRKPDVNKIDDEIIAEIRRSRFLVADFTQGKDGARGGVYFEAGFAFGLGIPVIHTCREDAIGRIHFDTRQYHHITWKNPEDLRVQLERRIIARIGDAPEISAENQAPDPRQIRM